MYLLAVDGPKAPNVSQLANDIETSRATVMNYIKYLADARLINMVYPVGEEFPKKPAKIMMHNSNLMYSIYPVKVEEQDVLDTFFVNTLWKDHKVNRGDKNVSFMVDKDKAFKICPEGVKIKILLTWCMLCTRWKSDVTTRSRCGCSVSCTKHTR